MKNTLTRPFKRLVAVLDGLPRLHKKAVMVANDAVLITASLWIALSLRFGTPFLEIRDNLFLFAALPFFTVPIFLKLGLYRAVIRYAGRAMLNQLFTGVLVSSGILLAITLSNWPNGLPRSAFVIYGFVAFMLIGGSRVLARRVFDEHASLNKKPAIILGVGSCGRQVAQMLRSGTDYTPVLFLDDDKRLIGQEVDGLRVYSPDDRSLPERVQQDGIEALFLAIPSVSRSTRRQLLLRIEHLPVTVFTVPPLRELLSGEATLAQYREVSIEDLLGRDQVPPDEALLSQCITGRGVLITGAGGSIGAELCRQALALKPRVLVLYEHSEFALFNIEKELRLQLAGGGVEQVPVVGVLGSILDSARVRQCLKRYRIETVYHAAAYKHVPIVEQNPVAGIRNNVLGTESVATEAVRAGVENFVLVSTDKAVRPVSVLGATKRLAELIVQGLAQTEPHTRFSMVRFGNVLDSSGSVIPLFRQQIADGGPVTVTSKEVTRFFMTIPEAVQLVIQAGSMAHGGDVFVLDMGEPVRIYDLARQLIHLSGHDVKDESNVEGDIEIVFTGLRPGEKLYEELLIGNNVSGTEHPKIMRAMESSLDKQTLDSILEELRRAIEVYDVERMRRLLVQAVDAYQPQGMAVDVGAHGSELRGLAVDPGPAWSDAKH